MAKKKAARAKGKRRPAKKSTVVKLRPAVRLPPAEPLSLRCVNGRRRLLVPPGGFRD